MKQEESSLSVMWTKFESKLMEAAMLKRDIALQNIETKEKQNSVSARTRQAESLPSEGAAVSHKKKILVLNNTPSVSVGVGTPGYGASVGLFTNTSAASAASTTLSQYGILSSANTYSSATLLNLESADFNDREKLEAARDVIYCEARAIDRRRKPQ